MVRVTDRDIQLLSTCAAAQWLTTGQVQRMFFQDSSLDAVRKRLRKLAEEGFLRSSQSNRMAEMLHGIGRAGQILLAERGIEAKAVRNTPDQIEHAIGINDIRIAVESDRWLVHYFFGCWELGKFGWRYSVVPDAVFSVETDRRMTFMVEYDRGTEGRDILQKKLRMYDSLLASYHFTAVIIAAESAKLRERLGHGLIGQYRFPFGICSIGDINDSGVAGPIYCIPGNSNTISIADLASVTKIWS